MRTRWNMSVWKCWFLRRGENRSTQRKTSQSKGENQKQTQPTYGVDARIRTRTTLVGGECCHHCDTLAPAPTEQQGQMGASQGVIKLIFLKGPLMALEAWLSALQSSSRGSSKKGKREPCMAKKVMLKFATCTKVKQSLYSLAQLILQFSLLRLMLRALSVPSFVSQCYTAQH